MDDRPTSLARLRPYNLAAGALHLGQAVAIVILANDFSLAVGASYMAGRLDFLRLIESQRQLLTLQDEYYAALAEYHQRLAALDHVTGTSLPLLK